MDGHNYDVCSILSGHSIGSVPRCGSLHRIAHKGASTVVKKAASTYKTLKPIDPLSGARVSPESMYCGLRNWSPDSKYLYFDSVGNDPAFRWVRLNDDRLEHLLSLKNIRIFIQQQLVAL